MYRNYSKRAPVKAEKKNDEDIRKLVRFAEGSKGPTVTPEEKKRLRKRIQNEKIELKRLKQNQRIQLDNKSKPSQKRINKRLPPVTPSQPTMSQCLAWMGEVHYDPDDICVQDILPCSQRMEYTQQVYTTEYESESYKSASSSRTTVSNTSTPDSKIKA